MRKNIFLLLIIFSFTILNAQERDTARVFSLSDIEQLFLLHNYQLLQQKHNISQAEAKVLQAKLWKNPQLSLSEVNLWHNKTIEELPPLWNGKPGKQQFAIELEQELLTAGKRRKNVQIKSLAKDIEELDFENLIRETKYEIRNRFAEYIRLELKEKLLRKLLNEFNALEKAYQRQQASQNISKIDLLRIEGEAKGYRTEIGNIKIEKQENLHALSKLIGTELPADIILKEDGTTHSALFESTPDVLEKTALETRPDLKALESQMRIASQNIALQKSERVPNLNLQVNYDHGGGVMHHFVGVGLSLDLPVFDRNKGNVQSAKIEKEKVGNSLNAEYFELKTELNKLWKQLHIQQETLSEWSENYLENLEQMLETSTRNFAQKNLSLVEYLDFIGFYVETLDEYYKLTEKHKKTKETLFYIIGKEL